MISEKEPGMVDLSDYEFEPNLARAATLPARWYVEPDFLALEKDWRISTKPAMVCTPCGSKPGGRSSLSTWILTPRRLLRLWASSWTRRLTSHWLRCARWRGATISSSVIGKSILTITWKVTTCR